MVNLLNRSDPKAAPVIHFSGGFFAPMGSETKRKGKEDAEMSELTPFGRQVKIRLLERQMDARELAERIGTSPVQISRILHGKRPGHEQIPLIARLLDIDLDALQKDA